MDKFTSSLEIKSVSTDDQRVLVGIASTPTPDRVKDVIEPTGLTARGSIPLLLGHDADKPVGTVTFGTPTAKGLPFTARIAKVEDDGEVKKRTDTAWHSVKSGLIKGVSIGFIPKESKALPNGGTHYTKAEVHELSLTATPCNPDAVITAFKSTQTPNHKELMTRNTLADQIRKAVAMSPDQALIESTKTKAAVPASTTSNTPALYYPGQAPGVVLPPVTTAIVAALANLGAPQLPPNVRILTQGALLQASEIEEGEPYPAAAPSVDFALTSRRKFGLILAFNDVLFAANNFNDSVVQYVQNQLEHAANNATDAFMVALMTANGTAANSVAAALAAFAGDLRTACWIGSPETLTTLQDAANPNIGPRGGTYKTLPAIASLAVPPGKLILQDVQRIAVFDGPEIVERSNEASIVMDTAPSTATSTPVSMFQQNMTALKITKYADANLLAAPQIITLA